MTLSPSWPVSFLTILPWKLTVSDVKANTEPVVKATKNRVSIGKMNKFFATFGQLVFNIFHEQCFILL